MEQLQCEKGKFDLIGEFRKGFLEEVIIELGFEG